MEMNYKIVIAAIICLTAIEIVALFKGINGTLMTIVIGAIAGLAGWITPQLHLNKDGTGTTPF